MNERLDAILDALEFWLVDELRYKLFDASERIPDRNALDVNMDKAEIAKLVEYRDKIQGLIERLGKCRD